jgi:non-heme chloroperoxidase
VIEKLKINRPVLAGWSIAGSELSSIGTRYPEKVAGLVYLDAAYSYAFYLPDSPGLADVNIGVNDLRDRATRLGASDSDPKDAVRQVDAMLNSLSDLQADLRSARKYYQGQRPLPPNAPRPQIKPMEPADAVIGGITKQGSPKAPILAIFAHPHKIAPTVPAALKARFSDLDRRAVRMINGFAAGNPKAKLVTIPQADHDVFNSNPDQVELEMKAFIGGLPR